MPCSSERVRIAQNHLGTFHLDTIDARDLKFGHFMGEKLPKMAAILDFGRFFAHKMPKIQNFQNRLTRSVELHTRKVHAKFQVPSMYGVQMNGT